MIEAERPPVVVFDLDGTLLDSAPGIAAALDRTGIGSGKVAVEDIRRLVSHGAAHLVQNALRLDDGDVAPALERFRYIYSETPCTIDHMYPGAMRALSALVEKGALVGICTNKPQKLADIVVARLGLSDLVRTVVGSTPARPDKPDPAPLLEVLRRLSADSRSVFIGDSMIDAQTAKAAGIPFVFAAYGYGPFQGTSVGVIDDLDALFSVVDPLLWPRS